MNVSKDFLLKSSSNPGAVDDNELEFTEFIRKSMVSLGSPYLHRISGDGNMLALHCHQVGIILPFQSSLLNFVFFSLLDRIGKISVLLLKIWNQSAVYQIIYDLVNCTTRLYTSESTCIGCFNSLKMGDVFFGHFY